jgi:hypothetical protein
MLATAMPWMAGGSWAWTNGKESVPSAKMAAHRRGSKNLDVHLIEETPKGRAGGEFSY